MVTNLPVSFDYSRTRQNHLEDHTALHKFYDSYAHVEPATGNATTDTANIQAAVDSGKHVLLTSGEYYFNTLTFNNANQTFESSSSASLRGAATNSTIIINAPEISFQNVYIQSASITGIVIQIQTSRFSAYRLYIDATNAAIGMLIVNAGLVRLIDCRISGNSLTQTGVGIEIQEGSYLMYFASVTINHWNTGIFISAPVSIESSVFIDVIFDNISTYGLRYDPVTTGIMYNPSFINCHFEGITTNIYIGVNANIYAGLFQNCRFGRNTNRCFVVDGVMRYTTVMSCFFTGLNEPDSIVYELNGINEFAIENLVDFNNYWVSTTLSSGILASELKTVQFVSIT